MACKRCKTERKRIEIDNIDSSIFFQKIKKPFPPNFELKTEEEYENLTNDEKLDYNIIMLECGLGKSFIHEMIESVLISKLGSIGTLGKNIKLLCHSIPFPIEDD